VGRLLRLGEEERRDSYRLAQGGRRKRKGEAVLEKDSQLV